MLFREKKGARPQMLATRAQMNPRVNAMNGFREYDQNGNLVPGSDPANFNMQDTTFYTPPEVMPGSGGYVSPPTGQSGGVNWSQIFTTGSQLATGIVNAIVQGTRPSAGGSCPQGYQYVAATGQCMTPAAYSAWLKAKSGGGSTMTYVLLGGAALVAAAVLMKRRGGGAMAGYSRRRRRVRR